MVTYFELGLTHILDWNGYDHMLFVLVMIAGVDPAKWRIILAMITGFTLGHSLTLAITVLTDPLMPSDIVEFFIPVTIFLTALFNFQSSRGSSILTALMVTLFGLIHGMGFAGYLSSLLPGEGSVVLPLLFFNLGVEAGQIIFALIAVAVFAGFRYFSNNLLNRARQIASFAAALISLFLAIQNWPF